MTIKQAMIENPGFDMQVFLNTPSGAMLPVSAQEGQNGFHFVAGYGYEGSMISQSKFLRAMGDDHDPDEHRPVPVLVHRDDGTTEEIVCTLSLDDIGYGEHVIGASFDPIVEK